MGGPGGPLWQRIMYSLAPPGPRTQAASSAANSGTLTIEDSCGNLTVREEVRFFDWLDQQLRTQRCQRPDAMAAALPFDFWGGYVGFLGYELKAECGGGHTQAARSPDAAFFRADRCDAIGTAHATRVAAYRYAGVVRVTLTKCPWQVGGGGSQLWGCICARCAFRQRCRRQGRCRELARQRIGIYTSHVGACWHRQLAEERRPGSWPPASQLSIGKCPLQKPADVWSSVRASGGVNLLNGSQLAEQQTACAQAATFAFAVP